jgi:hypothetical protein
MLNEKDEMSARDGGTSISDWDWQDDYAFHRHCQKTVCSAIGYSGNGRTWSVIYPGTGPLPNLQRCVNGTTSPETWQKYFNVNVEKSGKNNITYDLRAILELINMVAGKLFASLGPFTLTFKDAEGNTIASKDLDLINDPSRDYEFGGFGRNVKLKVGGALAASFNTMKPGTLIDGLPEQLDLPLQPLSISLGEMSPFNIVKVVMESGVAVKIPYNTLSFSFGNAAAFASTNVAMAAPVKLQVPYNNVNFQMLGKTFNTIKAATGQNWNITVPKDYNRITTSYGTSDPQGGAGTITQSGATYIVRPHAGVHIYRISASSNFNLKFNLANYQSRWDVFGRDFGQQILEFEVHIRNASASVITFANIHGTTLANWFTRWIDASAAATNFTYLNDKDTIEAYNTAAYVFRIDTYQRSMTWSLAYICPTSG